MSTDNLYKQMQEDGPPPCDGCHFREKCKSMHLACWKFLHYVDPEVINQERIPQRWLYLKAFPHVNGLPDVPDAFIRHECEQDIINRISKMLED